MNYPKPKLVSFRNEIKEIKNTSYITHSLYFHPAKFIPQIVRFCLNKYCIRKGTILDPFAGSGTAGLESSILDYNSILLDINPLLDFFYPIKIPEFTSNQLIKYKIEAIKIGKTLFENNNKKINRLLKLDQKLQYWYPKYLYDYFENIWQKYHSHKKNNLIPYKIVALALFKVSKKYSFAEHSMPKLFISKRKRKFIDELDKKSIFEKIKQEYKIEIEKITKLVNNVLTKYKLTGKITYYSGVDSYSFDYKKLPKYDCIITSPPYLQAQEYIRTFKLEMLWLGYSTNKINSFSTNEIPFRKPEGLIEGNYINKIRSKLDDKHLISLFDSYFWFTVKALEKASKKLKKGGKICILIGNPKMEGLEIEIWKVIYEYFVYTLDYKLVNLYDDHIVSRKLFKGRNNGNPDGMKSEFLLVLNKE